MSNKEIETIIEKYLPVCEGYPVKVIEAINYAFKAGGKRLRPALMNICFDLYRNMILYIFYLK